MHPKHHKRMATNKKWSTVEEKLYELGAASLTDAEVISLIIAPNSCNLSVEETVAELLSEFKGYEGLADKPLSEVSKIKGMGNRKALRLAAAMEFAKRWVGMAINMLKNDRELRTEVFGA